MMFLFVVAQKVFDGIVFRPCFLCYCLLLLTKCGGFEF